MAPQPFQPIFPPSKTHHPILKYDLAFLLNQFSAAQLALLGAIVQVLIFALLPTRYAFLPALALLLHTIITTIFALRDPSSAHLRPLIHQRVTAQLPEPTYDPRDPAGTPLYRSTAASTGLVVLHLGVRLSSPLGVAARGAGEMAEVFGACQKDLEARATEYGLLGSSGWTAQEGSSGNTTMGIYYFRDIEGLHRFAQDAVHRRAWDFYNRIAKDAGYAHIGVFHETFYTGPGQYETVYANMPPLLLGATNVPVRNVESGEDEFVRPLVSVKNPALKDMWGRMNRGAEGEMKTL